MLKNKIIYLYVKSQQAITKVFTAISKVVQYVYTTIENVFKLIFYSMVFVLVPITFILMLSSFGMLYNQNKPEMALEAASEHVVLITNSVEQGFGTGFYITAPSGKTYIMSNKHVCLLAEGGIVYINDETLDRKIPKRVLEVYTKHDLCLIESIEGKTGMEIGEESSLNDKVFTVGYPLMPEKNHASGRIKGKGMREVVFGKDMPVGQCKALGLSETAVTQLKGMTAKTTRVCTMKVGSTSTSLQTFPGNSGSPVVNIDGLVVGVIYASHRVTNWGVIVPLEDIQDFIAPY